MAGRPRDPPLSPSEPCVLDPDPTRFSVLAAHSLRGLWGKHLLASAGICAWSPMLPIAYCTGGRQYQRSLYSWLQLVEDAINYRVKIPGLFWPGMSLFQSEGSRFSDLPEGMCWHTLSPSGLRALLLTSLRLSRGSSTRNSFEERNQDKLINLRNVTITTVAEVGGGATTHKNKRRG